MNNIALARHEFVVNEFQDWYLEEPHSWIYRYEKGDTIIQWLPEESELYIGMINDTTEWKFFYKCKDDCLYPSRLGVSEQVYTDLNEVCNALNKGGLSGIKVLYDLKLVEDRLC